MKKIIINEIDEEKILNKIFEGVFYPKADMVIEIEDYLNKNFKPKELLTLDINGYPDFEKDVVMIKKNMELKTMTPKEVLRMLDDKFHDKIKDDDDRKRFLKQVIIDWYHGKIKNGILSVNYL